MNTLNQQQKVSLDNLVSMHNESVLPFIRVRIKDRRIIFSNKAATPLLRSLGCLVNNIFPDHLLPFIQDKARTRSVCELCLATGSGSYSLHRIAYQESGFVDLICFAHTEHSVIH